MFRRQTVSSGYDPVIRSLVGKDAANEWLTGDMYRERTLLLTDEILLVNTGLL